MNIKLIALFAFLYVSIQPLHASSVPSSTLEFNGQALLSNGAIVFVPFIVCRQNQPKAIIADYEDGQHIKKITPWPPKDTDRNKLDGVIFGSRELPGLLKPMGPILADVHPFIEQASNGYFLRVGAKTLVDLPDIKERTIKKHTPFDVFNFYAVHCAIQQVGNTIHRSSFGPYIDGARGIIKATTPGPVSTLYYRYMQNMPTIFHPHTMAHAYAAHQLSNKVQVTSHLPMIGTIVGGELVGSLGEKTRVELLTDSVRIATRQVGVLGIYQKQDDLHQIGRRVACGVVVGLMLKLINCWICKTAFGIKTKQFFDLRLGKHAPVVYDIVSSGFTLGSTIVFDQYLPKYNKEEQ